MRPARMQLARITVPFSVSKYFCDCCVECMDVFSYSTSWLAGKRASKQDDWFGLACWESEGGFLKVALTGTVSSVS